MPELDEDDEKVLIGQVPSHALFLNLLKEMQRWSTSSCFKWPFEMIDGVCENMWSVCNGVWLIQLMKC